MANCRKIVIAGETWSPNLGDGVIAESARFLFMKLYPDLRVEFLDISGRRSVGLRSPKPASFATRFAQKVKILDILRVVVKGYAVKSRHLNEWSAMISESDAVIIGGGQLLRDNSLSFPLKISFIAQLAYSLNKPVHFLSCGVGREWSRIASRLFGDVLVLASSITVRDTISQERLGAFLPGLAVCLSADPALWASDVYGQGQAAMGDYVGLGIMQGAKSNSRSKLVRFWVNIAEKLYRDGVHFELFTNGSLRDYALALSVVEAIREHLSISCNLVSRPTEPYELARSISKYKAVIASRLHAHIIATSYCIPSIALPWDDKVHAFFRDIGRESFALSRPEVEEADNVIRSLYRCMDEPIDEAVVMEKRELVFKNVRTILNTMGLA